MVLELGMMCASLCVIMGAIRRYAEFLSRRLDDLNHKIDSLHRCNSIERAHHTPTDPEPIAITVQPEPPKGDLPRATARTRRS